jgi:uncharacterized protein (TIRG00374 family)
MKYLKYVLHVVVILGVVLAGVRYLDSELMVAALANFTPPLAVLVLSIPALQLAVKSWRFVVFLRPLVRMPDSVPFRAYAAGQPATLLPGGIAARIGLMKQVGVPVGTSSAAVLFSSLFDQVVFIAGLMLAALLFPAARTMAMIVLVVVASITLLLLLEPVRRSLAWGARRLVARFGFESGWERFARAVHEELGGRIIAVALLLSLAAFVADLILLDMSLRGVGYSLPYLNLFLVYLLPTMLGRLSALPAGGIGVAEAGMVGYLVLLSDITPDVAAAAVAVFRVAAVFLQALFGAFVYLFFWRGEHELERDEPKLLS